MSSNQPGRNARQQELVKRLEEIRKKRQQEANPTPRNQIEIDQARQNEAPKRRNVQPQKRKQKKSSSQPVDRNTAQLEQYKVYQEEVKIQRPSSKKESKATNQQRKKKKKNLIKQLSDSHSLANALILNEVLSKPIALSNKNP